jgi:hypothetical protein
LREKNGGNVKSGEDSWVIAATFVCPLDVIRTRLQVHGLGGSVWLFNGVGVLIFRQPKVEEFSGLAEWPKLGGKIRVLVVLHFCV